MISFLKHQVCQIEIKTSGSTALPNPENNVTANKRWYYRGIKGLFSPGLSKILSNISWLTVEKFFQMAVGLVVGVWFARYFGPEQYGLFNYVIAFVSLFSFLSTLGLENIVIRDIVMRPQDRTRILGSVFLLKFLGSSLLIFLSLAVISLLKPGDQLLRYFVGIAAFGYLFKSFDSIDLWFQSQVQAKYSAIARICSLLIISAVKISFIVMNMPLVAFFWLFSINFALDSVGFLIFYRMTIKEPIFNWRVSSRVIKELFFDGWPLMISAMAVMLYMRIDQVMLGQMLGDRAVGIYSVAVRISELFYFLPIFITASVYPAIINAKKVSEKLYLGRLQKLYDYFTWTALGISILVSLSARFIISGLYGSQYHDSVSVLLIHTWASLFVFLGVASGKYLIAENMTSMSLMRTLTGVSVNILLNLYLIPKYGAIGAAMAALLSQMTSAYISNIFFKQTRIIFVMYLRSFNFIRIVRELKWKTA